LCATLCSAKPDAVLRTVPYLGKEEPYFFGNGIAGAGGDTRGKWDFLIGPDYTSPNFVSEELLSLRIDGKSTELSLQMHRARETGVFTGLQRIGDVQVWVSDFALPGSSWVARYIVCLNLSPKSTVNVTLNASITPGTAITRIENPSALILRAAKGTYCFGNETKNWADRFSQISFSEPTSITDDGKRFQIKTIDHLLPPGGILRTGLYHWQYYDEDKPAQSYTYMVQSRQPETDLKQSVVAWKSWMQSGSRALANVTDPKARDVVEGSLIACKMQQNRDGGTIAGARKYANSYIRDTHGAVRLFLATGHYSEAKRAIETIFHKWSVAGFIPNYWSMGSDSFIGHSFYNDSSEITGYYVLMIRDYLARTKDAKFVESLEKSIRFAIDAQLDSLTRNGWRISFNGDETEQYCVREDGKEYGGFPAFPQWRRDSWSFPSAAIAVASTQFYIDFLKSKGRRDTAALYEIKLKKVKAGIDSTFWRPELTPAHHHWARYKDGTWPDVTVPNYGLIPVWLGARLNYDRQKADANAMKTQVASSGFLPTAPPEVMGFCGHNLGYLLYDLVELGDPAAKDVLQTLVHAVGCWGTMSEFYGPNATPNGHNFRVFESGITAEAILQYFAKK